MEYMTLNKRLEKKFKKLFNKIDEFELKHHGALPQGITYIWGFTIPEARVKAVQSLGRFFHFDNVFNVDTESKYSFLILGGEDADLGELPGRVLKEVEVKAYVESGFQRDFCTYLLTTKVDKFKLD
ncbi:hypothetical protein GF352_03000 [archaeon]|nr:hypothetical protein [archaeon]